MHQHTGNWPGKTVNNATGKYSHFNKDFLLVDIPGTYSIMSNSDEEEIARDYICFGNPDVTVIVVDSTCLERNLNLVFQTMEITDNIIVCVNLLDEAEKKGIEINFKKLSDLLGVPVVGTTARKKKTLKNLTDTIYNVCTKKVIPNPKKIEYITIIENAITLIQNQLKNFELIPDYIQRWVALKLIDNEKNILSSIEKNLKIDFNSIPNLSLLLNDVYSTFSENDIDENNFRDTIVSSIMFKSESICKDVCTFKNKNYRNVDRKIDKILTSKKIGIPIMMLFLGVIFWLTIVGANYPSQILFKIFLYIQNKLIIFSQFLHTPQWLSDMLILGVYQTLTWIISVMLPPMAIFFPLFTILEDLGYLPRIAFNMDGLFKKACCSR